MILLFAVDLLEPLQGPLVVIEPHFENHQLNDRLCWIHSLFLNLISFPFQDRFNAQLFQCDCVCESIIFLFDGNTQTSRIINESRVELMKDIVHLTNLHHVMCDTFEALH